jgi:peptidoglycan/LPS O-acetylase OafA/YrhL
MQLPFTTEQFFDLFAAYNGALWPAAVALWIASTMLSALLLSSRRPPDRWISALLSVHWLWSALAYHTAFFTRINPAAWVFAALFLVQAALFFWIGVVRRRLSFAPGRNAWAVVAWLFVAYSLVYPGINAVQHLTWSRIPTFGVPCPTTIFTAGLLMLATPRSWRLSIIPVVWSVIGGSAALLLGVSADYALPVAGISLAVFSFRSRATRWLG